MAAAEVQALLQEARRAQEHEDDGDCGAAAECYYKAACQLSYVLDLQVEKGSALAAMCQGLLQMYQQRIAVLRARSATAKGPHWVQLEQQLGSHDLVSSATAPTAFGFRAAPSWLPPLPQAPNNSQQQPAQAMALAAAAASEGLQQVYDEPCSPTGSSCASLELLRSCQRSVSGSLDDVVGLESVKDELEEAVFLPLQHPHLFQGPIRTPARTFLLHGPPGTGKTLLVEKVAAEAGFMLLSVSPSMVLSKWAGDSEKAVRGVFEVAKSFQPCIIFLDEVDSLGQARGSNTDAGARRLLTELLIQFTHAAAEEGVYVFGATNRMQDCDPALLRRFSRRIEVPLPDAAARTAFFAGVLARPELGAALSSADVQQLVGATAGYSGSDLADVCRTAALQPVRDLLRQQRAGCKRRRRDGSSAALLCDDAGSGGALSAAQQKGQGQGQGQTAGSRPEGVAAEGTQVQDQVPAATRGAELRRLVLADFQAALAVVKPAAVDAGIGG